MSEKINLEIVSIETDEENCTIRVRTFDEDGIEAYLQDRVPKDKIKEHNLIERLSHGLARYFKEGNKDEKYIIENQNKIEYQNDLMRIQDLFHIELKKQWEKRRAP